MTAKLISDTVCHLGVRFVQLSYIVVYSVSIVHYNITLQAASCQVSSLEIRVTSGGGTSRRHFRQRAGGAEGGATSVVEELRAKDLEGASSIGVHLTVGRSVDSGDYIGFQMKWSFQ